ncbi:MAG: hypothetical protein UV67_C0011G0005 [Parcubacteria group bacterium GW2011_GWC1_43_12]|nr:MAG: hypothetical protein UV34_C0042G0004 [Parcubacteria group bacterium GW2011_GWB1_42_6]KKS92049.1 MAG: hypothetical protein UV67_C0011G0005 [Parcubacteria group bacterium GW2011_GWC1_43_12]
MEKFNELTPLVRVCHSTLRVSDPNGKTLQSLNDLTPSYLRGGTC